MPEVSAKHKVALLRVLRDAARPVGSAVIAKDLQGQGIDLSSRTIRLYLQHMEKEGLVARANRGRNGGRTITPRGVEEIKDALVTARLGFTVARVDTLAAQMTFSLASRAGLIVLNVTTIEETHLVRAMDVMMPIFRAGLGMGEYLALAGGGESLGRYRVAEGRIGIGTVCSVTINGVFLAARIPTASRFGGVLEMDGGKPVRFTDVIGYDGTSLDPLEIFIKGRLLSVRETARKGKGRIGVSFREVPTCALGEVEKILRRLDRIGLNGVLMVGRPNQPLLDFPVHNDRTGLIVNGGLNPVAALEEAGIPNENAAMAALFEFEKLLHYRVLAERIAKGEYAPRQRVGQAIEPVHEDWAIE